VNPKQLGSLKIFLFFCFYSAAPDSIDRISFLLLLGEPETARIAVILYPSPGSGNRFPEPLRCLPALTLPPPPSAVVVL
jgi:hypothetical protein